MLALLGLQWLVQMNADGTGYLAQRTMACRSDKDAKIASVVFAFTQVLGRSLLWLPIGLGLLVLFPPDGALSLEALRAEREATYVQGIKDLLPPGLLGLMLTGMLAALASTVDTHLNWGASYWTNDIYKRFICQAWRQREPSARTLVWVARLSNILILILALVIMTRLTSIQKAWQTSLLLGAGMSVMLVFRWLWWRVTAWGEIATIAASTLAAWPLLVWVNDQAVRLLVMAAVATTAGVVTSLLTGPELAERLREFYRRAQPPGFWGPVSGDVTAGVQRLRRQAAATVTAALSLFCLLVGAGSWIAHSPPPGWLPWRGAWIALNLLLGAALVPVWWRLGGVNDKQAD
ncbi:MAG: hypothetical protein HYZ27_04175 [Deltaproteobacteria bacterium]|nr:hypothetical protein [Deltaproteobacteria bacterium]